MSLRTLMLAAGSVALMAAASPVFAQTTTPPPASAWAREAAMASVNLSPDGEHLVALISPDGATRVIAIWRTDALDQPPYIVGSGDERAEIVGVSFVKNDRLFVTTQQLSEYNAAGQARASYRSFNKVIDLEGNEIEIRHDYSGMTDNQRAAAGVGGLISTLPSDPENILVQFRAGDIFRVNLYSGQTERVERGSDRFQGPQADLQGNIRARSEFGFDSGAAYIAQWIRHPDTNEWEEHFRWYARDREPIEIVSFTNDPNIVFVSSTRDRDRAAILEYNIRERRFLDEPAFAHPLFEANDVILSTREEDYGEVVGFTYAAERGQTYWLDPAIEQIGATLRQAMGVQTERVTWVDIVSGQRVAFDVADGADVLISDWDNDRRRFIVTRSGPEQPPEYYLMQDGRARLLGRAYPDLQDAAFGDTELIQYPARDGLMIPAFLTTPDPEIHGAGPYPTIITPHGGPWSRDSMTWDPTGWTQYFATRGYAVLQPQFRGSEGWGQRLWRAGDSEWGGRMQDDNDDGVRYLIDQGIAAPDRVAMHGYSYGGYASMMAAVRPNGLYQCAAAGAGPSTMEDFKRGTYDNRFLREFQHPTAEGVDPLDRAAEISIPLYLYSGDRDTNVVPEQSERMAAALRSAGLPVQLRILPDMEHGLSSWTPANIEVVLTSVEQFLRTECGPDGL